MVAGGGVGQRGMVLAGWRLAGRGAGRGGGAAWLEVGGCWGVGTDGGSLGWGGRSTNFFRKYEISPSIQRIFPEEKLQQN